MEKKTVLVTGGAGFIGSCFVRLALAANRKVVVLDLLTYAGSQKNLEEVAQNPNYSFIQGDICDSRLVNEILQTHRPEAIVHFAAESHVDNSINGPSAFIKTNIEGSFVLLEMARKYFAGLSDQDQKLFRFVHVSTDEVFGSLNMGDSKFSENTAYAPNSPYSASKAASDHLARAWFHTYKLPVIITNCSNNYGPRQFPEKLIPKTIMNAVNWTTIPVYGAGENIRDWIHVEDHCQGIWLALTKGTPGEVYCFGGDSERKNIDLVKNICKLMDEVRPHASGGSYASLIKFVTDRPGHDFRYAIDNAKAVRELGYKLRYDSFEAGIKNVVNWYLERQPWLEKSIS